MSRTRPWDPKSTKVGTGGSLSPAVSSSSSSSSCCSPSPSPSTSRLAYAGSAPVAPLLRPATFHYGGLGVEEDQEQQQQQHENSEEEEEEEEEEEQEAEEDNDSTARTLADEERYSEDQEDQEDENDGVADTHRSFAEESHNYKMAFRLCQDGGSQGESNCREGEEEAGAEPGQGTWELRQEDDDAGRAASGVHDPGRDRGHGAVGRCPFRQYMPSKPARYGIKIWVACDARSSYAWKMQVYTGKPDKRGPPEKHLATRVVVDLTEGLAPGRNVTCDNFFTSRELADRLFRERGHTVLGTLRSNRPEIPRELRCVKGRAVGSVESVVLGGSAGPRRGGGGGGGGGGRGPDTIILSYVAKKNKNVLLLTTAPRYHRHHHRRRSGPEPRPSRRSSSNGNSNSGGGGKPPLADDADASTTRTADATPRDSSPVKRRRCRVCPRSKDVKTKILWHECRVYVCTNCAVTYCPNCAASRTAASQTPPTL
ncbi:unnamed protein product [Oreochromis niloticus]|nr:unnamed protein product [Mustela putorius furo]